jgi:hypothetical protein
MARPLGLELTIHIIKSQIHLVKTVPLRKLYCYSKTMYEYRTWKARAG